MQSYGTPPEDEHIPGFPHKGEFPGSIPFGQWFRYRCCPSSWKIPISKFPTHRTCTNPNNKKPGVSGMQNNRTHFAKSIHWLYINIMANEPCHKNHEKTNNYIICDSMGIIFPKVRGIKTWIQKKQSTGRWYFLCSSWLNQSHHLRAATKVHETCTPPPEKTKCPPEKGPFPKENERNMVFQPSFARGHVRINLHLLHNTDSRNLADEVLNPGNITEKHQHLLLNHSSRNHKLILRSFHQKSQMI